MFSRGYVEREVLLESISSFLIYNQVLVEQKDFHRLELEVQNEFLMFLSILLLNTLFSVSYLATVHVFSLLPTYDVAYF